ncbi:MAG: hypothetical protein ABWY66_12055 [Xanthobacteraceae bacterium]|jgi:hypothetical protein
MLRWLCLLGLFAVIAPANAQEAATLGKLPEVHVLTALKSGDWEDLGDLVGEALDEVDEMADDRDLKLSKTEVVIYEMAGLKNFRARIGYLLDPETKAKPGRFGKNIELRHLKGAAYVASGVGGAAAVIPIRRKVLDELEKPGVKRLKGVETIEIFYGDMDDKETKVEVYGPLR